MKRDDAIRAIRPRLPELRRLGVVSLSLFGSTARDDASETSDVDILISFDAPPSFNHFMDAKFILEDALGQTVDLATPSGLKPQFRPIIEREAIRVA